jgi:hypothetical protein
VTPDPAVEHRFVDNRRDIRIHEEDTMKCCISLLLWSATVLVTGAASGLEPEWSPTGGPDGLTAFDVVDTTDGTVILATIDGVWRLPVGESRWSRSGLDGLWVHAVGRAADELLFAAAYLHSNWIPYAPSIYRSTDGGQTWIEANSGLSSAARWVWDLEPGPSGAMLAAGDDGVFRFNTATEAWERYSPAFVATSVATDGTRVYASGMTDVFRTTDSGATWTQTFVVGDAGINAIAAGDDGLVVAVAELSDIWLADDGVVFISTDYGDSFRLADGEFGAPGSIGFSFAYDTEVLTEGTILVGGFRFLSFGVGSGLKASTDLGETWESIGNGRLDVYRVEQLTDDRIWVAGYHNVMVFDAGSWTRAADGLGGAEVLSLAATPTGIVAGGFLEGVSALDPIDSAWRWLGPDLESAHDVAVMPNGDVVAAFRDMGALRWSPDNDWVSFSPEDENAAVVAVGPAGMVCVGGHHGCSCSADGIDDWITTTFEYHHFTAMTAMLDGAFAVAYLRPFTNTGFVARTLDGGLSWDTTDEVPSRIQDLHWDRYGDLWLLQETGKVSVSHDLGLTWEQTGDAGSGSAWTSLTVDRLGRLYAGSGEGFLRMSSDRGRSWQSFGAAVPDQSIMDLATYRGVLYAAITGRGVWATPVAPLVRNETSAGRRVIP